MWQRSTIKWGLAALGLLLMVSLWVFLLGWSDTTFANLSAERINDEVKASLPQDTEPEHLPKHPLEDSGVAGLTESAGMLENAISQSEAIDIVAKTTWGHYRAELQEKYPATVAPAVYNAKESVMGSGVEGRAVWVVTLQGWGPALLCGSPALPSEPDAENDCVPGQSNGHYIIDAVSGELLAGWHFGERGR
jgi:hypothetical protein